MCRPQGEGRKPRAPPYGGTERTSGYGAEGKRTDTAPACAPVLGGRAPFLRRGCALDKAGYNLKTPQAHPPEQNGKSQGSHQDEGR